MKNTITALHLQHSKGPCIFVTPCTQFKCFGKLNYLLVFSSDSEKSEGYYEVSSLNRYTLKEITSQTDKYLVNLSSKTYVFEDKLISISPFDELFLSVYSCPVVNRKWST